MGVVLMNDVTLEQRCSITSTRKNRMGWNCPNQARDGGKLCLYHLEYHRKAHQKYLAKKISGQCCYCDRPAKSNGKQCEHHSEKHKGYYRLRQKRERDRLARLVKYA